MRYIFMVDRYGYFRFVPAHQADEQAKRGFSRFMSVRVGDRDFSGVSLIASVVYLWAFRHYNV